MASTAAFAFANTGTIAVNVGGAVTGAAVLGVVKDVEITVSAEHVNLYGWGSILRQAVAKHSAKVSVKIGYMKVDPVITTGFQFSMLHPGTADGAFLDSNTVQLFCIEGLFVFQPDSTGSPALQHLHAKVENVYFPNFPLKMAEGQWMKVDMTGEGSTVTFTNTV